MNLKLDGWIGEVHVNYVGQPVARGQSLFTLSSPELLSAQTDLVAALRNRDQVLKASDGAQYNARMVEAPRQRLVLWDIPEDQLRAIEDKQQVRPAVIFRSPAAGVVIEKNVLSGMHVEAGRTLYRIADLSVVWIEAAFRELDLADLRIGSAVTVTTDAWPDRKIPGRILNVYPYMAEQARTVRARIALENRDGRLKPGMFVDVVVVAAPRDGLWVPADAVLDSGTRQIVFLAQGDGQFEPRAVSVGTQSEGQILILDGLREGDEIVASATFFVDSESQMRAALRNYEPAPPHAEASSRKGGFNISLTFTPTPPRAGRNVADVRILDAAGQPVTDAEIRLLFYMAPMPSMNMPEMRSEARLTHLDKGVYRGPAAIPMGGRWDITATASRLGQPIAEQRASLVVR